MNFLRLSTLFLLLLLAASCDDVSPEESAVHQSIPAVFIIGTDYQSGSFSLVDPETRAVSSDVAHIYQDAICRPDQWSSRIFVVQRWGSDAIATVDPAGNWKITNEYSVGPGTNPQDIAPISADKAYVSRLNEPDLLIIRPETGEEIGKIDLSSLADADQLPEASWMLVHDQQVFVSVLQLDSRNGYIPGSDSRIAVVDSRTDQVIETLTTSNSNPASRLRYSAGLEQIVIVESGIWSVMHSDAPFDGAIEYLNPADLSLSGPIITEEDLGGDLVDAVILTPHKGYALIGFNNGDGAGTRLVAIDPSERRATEILMESPQWDYSDLELSPDTRTLWVADRSSYSPGVHLFNTADNTRLAGPLPTGLPPHMICFVEEPLNN